MDLARSFAALAVAAWYLTASPARAEGVDCASEVSKKTLVNLLAAQAGKPKVYSFDGHASQTVPYLMPTVRAGVPVEASILYYQNAHLALGQGKLTASLKLTGGSESRIEMVLCAYKVAGDLTRARLEHVTPIKATGKVGSERAEASARAAGANAFTIHLRPTEKTSKTAYQLSVR